MKFRIWTIFWAFALLASAMATFGFVVSAFACLLVTGFWTNYYQSKRELISVLLVMLTVIVVVSTLMLSAFSTPRYVVRRFVCANNMRQLALSILNYESTNGYLPAQASSPPDHNHMHSWRLWTLPYLESSALYDEYNMDEPWDSPDNVKVVAQYRYANVLQCPSYHSSTKGTHYFAIVGEQTTWPPDRGRQFGEITDGTANTILLIEAPHKEIPWAKPEDMSFEEAVELLISSPTEEYGHEVNAGFFYKPVRGIHVTFVDGWTQLIELPISKAAAEALLTVDGGEPIDRDNLTAHHRPQLNYARIYSLSVFLVLSLLPVVKLRRKPRVVEADD